MNVANAPDCPWCGEKMRFDADSVHCWFKCDNCLAASPKALRAWDVAKSTKDNWADNEQHALRLTKEVEWHVHPPRWISVEERLPEGEVIAANFAPGTYGYKEYLLGYVHKHDDLYYAENSFEILNTVTHWMPLPEPPKEECK